MFRLLGFLIGSAASVAAILMVTGVPNFHLEDPVIDQDRFDEAVEKLMARKLEVEQSMQDVIEETEAPVVIAQDTDELAVIQDDEAASPDDEVSTEADLAQPAVTQASEVPLDAAQPSATELEFSAPGTQATPLTDMQWYSFWNPFRSNIAASGFVTRLEKVTGLDYRVVKVKTGVYEVAFAYNSDSERVTKLSQISAATGLDLAN